MSYRQIEPLIISRSSTTIKVLVLLLNLVVRLDLLVDLTGGIPPKTKFREYYPVLESTKFD